MLTETDSSFVNLTNSTDHQNESSTNDNEPNETEVIFDDESSLNESSETIDNTKEIIINNNENVNNNNQQREQISEINNQNLDKKIIDEILVPSTSSSSIQSIGVASNNEINKEKIVTVDSDDESETEYDIIDGIMFLNFETKDQLNEFTSKDEKLRDQNHNEKTKRKISTSRKSINRTLTNSTGKSISNKKTIPSSTITSDQQNHQSTDSAFVSDELDDYLNKKSGTKTNETTSSIATPTTVRKSTNRRKSTHLYKEDSYLYDNSYSFFDRNDSDNSSFTSSTTTNRKSSSVRSNNSIRSNQNNRSSKGKSIKKMPEILLVNEAIIDLNESDDLDDAYSKCAEQVQNAYSANLNKLKDRFKPVYLHQQHVCRTVLSALHPNVIKTNNNNSNSIKKVVPEKVIPKTSLSTLLTSDCKDNLKSIGSTSSTTKPIAEFKNFVDKPVNEQPNNSFVDKTKLKQPVPKMIPKVPDVIDISSNSVNSSVNDSVNNSISTVISSSSTSFSSKSVVNNKNIYFKLDPDDDVLLSNLSKTSEPIEFDKVTKRKSKNEYHEQGFDIACIISKHNSKRDIRLPARYNESVVGTQWILPNFEENKNRIVNTGNNKRQSTKPMNKERKSTFSNKSTSSKIDMIDVSNNLIQNNHYDFSSSMTSLNGQSISGNESYDTNYNLDDLMSEDEDNSITLINNLKTSCQTKPTISNHVNNSISNKNDQRNSNKEKEMKLLILKELYRQLFYANQPDRMEYYTKRLIKPRVNKSEVVEEGVKCIKALEKEQKSFVSANNVLISWNNRLKLCLKEIEQSNYQLNQSKIDDFNNLLHTYRTKGLNKFNLHITTAREQRLNSNSFNNANKKPNLSTSIANQPSPPQIQQPQVFANQIGNSFNKLDGTNLISFNKNPINLNPTIKPPPSTISNHQFNCQSNVAFLNNTNGISRVMNLKPKKSITIQTTKSMPSTMVNSNFNLKSNAIKFNSNSTNPVTGIHRSKLNSTNGKFIKSKNINHLINGNSLLNNKNQIISNTTNNLNKNFLQCNNVNFVPSPNNIFVTFKITNNRLELPYCPPTEVPIANAQPQPNHLPQLVPNHTLAQPPNPSAFVATKFLNPHPNFLKPNEMKIAHSHPNLSITETSSAPPSATVSNPSTSSSQPLVRNYPKILPKFTSNNLIIPNLQMIPSTHNLVISPINSPINSMISTSTANCQVRPTFCPPKPNASVIALHNQTQLNTNSKSTESSSLKLIVSGNK